VVEEVAYKMSDGDGLERLAEEEMVMLPWQVMLTGLYLYTKFQH
jgi:hypothetical protein